ncbi:NDR1/HIN1-like protein 10 [Diospyros lotus]|uniref:NDR1/HIN1-like protein 10 n=1 Tax=Diospyros lotus TaxID=55363 RepID=UPI0022547734|nr:NDR1/HIN1-like protein 10 [Diospyros lotus]
MAEAKQPYLNGAFYGPSIPSVSHHPSRGRGCGCGCCLLSFLLKIVIFVVFLVCLAFFLFWLVFRPKVVKFHVTDAALRRFDLNTATNMLDYDLPMNLTIRNPNKHIGIYYDRLEASAFYEDQRLVTIPLPNFYQGHKNTTTLNLHFKGQKMVGLQASDLEKYNSQNSSGAFNIDVKLYLRIRFKLRDLKTHKFKPKIKCDLKVPLQTSGSFETERCDIDW